MSMEWRAYLHCELWDLAAEGIDKILDLARGELGADGIRVSAVTSDICALRARPNAQPRTFRCPPAAHFQPDSSVYGDTRLRPPVAAWIKSRNPLAQSAAACAERGLKLRIRVTACDNSTLLERHPHVACVDAFGDASPTRLCPANPDVRAYLRDLIDDLASNYGVEAVDLADADFGAPSRFNPGRTQPAPPFDADSLALCFCPSCRRLAADAGIDADALASHIIKCFDAGESPDTRRIEAFESFRAGIICDMLAGLSREPRRCEVWWDASDSGSRRGAVPAAVAEYCTGQIVRFDQPAVVHASCERIGIEYPIGLDRQIEEGAPSVVREVSELTTRGHRVFVFDQFGTLPLERLDWVRQAVRFARRQAE